MSGFFNLNVRKGGFPNGPLPSRAGWPFSMVLLSALRQALVTACVCGLGFGLPPAQAQGWPTDSLAKLEPLARAGNPQAQYFVGMLYSLGTGGASRDLDAGFSWFQQAAAGQDPLGSYKLGCYYAGQYASAVPLDREKALAHKRAAALAGYALAQSDVAGMYHQRGDFTQAVHWWTMAAEQGYAPAASNLAAVYFQGKDVPKDVQLAHRWALITQGLTRRPNDEKMLAFLAKVTEEMTPEALQESRATAKRWTPKPSALTREALMPKPVVESLLARSAAPVQ